MEQETQILNGESEKIKDQQIQYRFAILFWYEQSFSLYNPILNRKLISNNVVSFESYCLLQIFDFALQLCVVIDLFQSNGSLGNQTTHESSDNKVSSSSNSQKYHSSIESFFVSQEDANLNFIRHFVITIYLALTFLSLLIGVLRAKLQIEQDYKSTAHKAISFNLILIKTPLSTYILICSLINLQDLDLQTRTATLALTAINLMFLLALLGFILLFLMLRVPNTYVPWSETSSQPQLLEITYKILLAFVYSFKSDTTMRLISLVLILIVLAFTFWMRLSRNLIWDLRLFKFSQYKDGFLLHYFFLLVFSDLYQDEKYFIYASLLQIFSILLVHYLIHQYRYKLMVDNLMSLKQVLGSGTNTILESASAQSRLRETFAFLLVLYNNPENKNIMRYLSQLKLSHLMDCMSSKIDLDVRLQNKFNSNISKFPPIGSNFNEIPKLQTKQDSKYQSKKESSQDVSNCDQASNMTLKQNLSKLQIVFNYEQSSSYQEEDNQDQQENEKIRVRQDVRNLERRSIPLQRDDDLLFQMKLDKQQINLQIINHFFDEHMKGISNSQLQLYLHKLYYTLQVSQNFHLCHFLLIQFQEDKKSRFNFIDKIIREIHVKYFESLIQGHSENLLQQIDLKAVIESNQCMTRFDTALMNLSEQIFSFWSTLAAQKESTDLYQMGLQITHQIERVKFIYREIEAKMSQKVEPKLYMRMAAFYKMVVFKSKECQDELYKYRNCINIQKLFKQDKVNENAKEKGIIIAKFDQNGPMKIFFMNQAALKMTKYQAAQIGQIRVSSLMPTIISENHNLFISRFLNSGRSKLIGKERLLPIKSSDNYITLMKISLFINPANYDHLNLFLDCDESINPFDDAENQDSGTLAAVRKLQSVGYFILDHNMQLMEISESLLSVCGLSYELIDALQDDRGSHLYLQDLFQLSTSSKPFKGQQKSFIEQSHLVKNFAYPKFPSQHYSDFHKIDYNTDSPNFKKNLLKNQSSTSAFFQQETLERFTSVINYKKLSPSKFKSITYEEDEKENLEEKKLNDDFFFNQETTDFSLEMLLSGKIFSQVKCRFTLDTVREGEGESAQEDEMGFGVSQKLNLAKDFSFDRNNSSKPVFTLELTCIAESFLDGQLLMPIVFVKQSKNESLFSILQKKISNLSSNIQSNVRAVEDHNPQLKDKSIDSSDQEQIFQSQSSQSSGSQSDSMMLVFSKFSQQIDQKNTPITLKLIMNIFGIVMAIILVTSVVEFSLTFQNITESTNGLHITYLALARLNCLRQIRPLVQSLLLMGNGYQPLNSSVYADRFTAHLDVLDINLEEMRRYQVELESLQLFRGSKLLELDFLDSKGKFYSMMQTGSQGTYLYLSNINEIVQQGRRMGPKGYFTTNNQILNNTSVPEASTINQLEQELFMVLYNQNNNLYDDIRSFARTYNALQSAIQSKVSYTQTMTYICVALIFTCSVIAAPITFQIVKRIKALMGLFLDFTREEINLNLTQIAEFDTFMSHQATFKREAQIDNSASVKLNSQSKTYIGQGQTIGEKDNPVSKVGGISLANKITRMVLNKKMEKRKKQTQIEDSDQKKVQRKVQGTVNQSQVYLQNQSFNTQNNTHPDMQFNNNSNRYGRQLNLNDIREESDSISGSSISSSSVSSSQKKAKHKSHKGKGKGSGTSDTSKYRLSSDHGDRHQSDSYHPSNFELGSHFKEETPLQNKLRDNLNRTIIRQMGVISVCCLVVISYFIIFYILSNNAFNSMTTNIDLIKAIKSRKTSKDNIFFGIQQPYIENRTILINGGFEEMAYYLTRGYQEEQVYQTQIVQANPSQLSDIYQEFLAFDSSSFCDVYYDATKQRYPRNNFTSDSCKTVAKGVAASGIDLYFSKVITSLQQVQIKFNTTSRQVQHIQQVIGSEDYLSIRDLQLQLTEDPWNYLEDKALALIFDYNSEQKRNFLLLFCLFLALMTIATLVFFFKIFRSMKEEMLYSNKMLYLINFEDWNEDQRQRILKFLQNY